MYQSLHISSNKADSTMSLGVWPENVPSLALLEDVVTARKDALLVQYPELEDTINDNYAEWQTNVIVGPTALTWGPDLISYSAAAGLSVQDVVSDILASSRDCSASF